MFRNGESNKIRCIPCPFSYGSIICIRFYGYDPSAAQGRHPIRWRHKSNKKTNCKRRPGGLARFFPSGDDVQAGLPDSLRWDDAQAGSPRQTCLRSSLPRLRRGPRPLIRPWAATVCPGQPACLSNHCLNKKWRRNMLRRQLPPSAQRKGPAAESRGKGRASGATSEKHIPSEQSRSI